MFICVVLAIDEHIEDVKKCVNSLHNTYGLECPIALATYGGTIVGEQEIIKAYADIHKFQYIDIPRHDFLTIDDQAEWHTCEAMARVQITKHLADQGYEEIYIMHSDVRILGDFRPFFQAKGHWSLKAILLRARDSLNQLCEKGSWGIYFEDNPARLADLLIRYNTAYVGQLCEKYKTPSELWDNFFSNFILWADLAQFDMAKTNMGYTGVAITEKDDLGPMCGGTVLHESRQAIPMFIPKEKRVWVDRAKMIKNYSRRTHKC